VNWICVKDRFSAIPRNVKVMRKYLIVLLTTSFLFGFFPFIKANDGSVVPVVFYLTNLPADRIGTDSDLDIIRDLESDGFFVVTLDMTDVNHLESPLLEEYLMAFHENSPQYLTENYPELNFDTNNFFYIPEGYRIERDIPVWNFIDHGADGTLDRVMRTYNEDIVPKFGIDPVSNPDDMVGPNGEPIDYNLYMDVIYPSGAPSEKVPLVLQFSSSSERHASFRPSNIKRGIFPTGFLTTGYAWVNVDHCYNPLARNEFYGYFDRYSLEDWNGLASATAYIRYLRAHADTYNLNGKIGVMGISKASYSAVRIADLNNATAGEHFVFTGYEPNNKPQPWSGHASTVDVAYAAAGNGTRRIPTYVDSQTVPMVTSVGRSDEYGHWEVYADLVKHMRDLDLNHLELWMEELGHTYPRVGEDYVSGRGRYRMVKDYFDHYLKPDDVDKLEVFYVLPKADATEVNNYGHSRFIPHDGLVPSNMQGMTPYLPLTVRFLSVVDQVEFESKVSVVNKAGNTDVAGTWTSKMGGTAFEFTPASPLDAGEVYEVRVSAGLTDVNELVLGEELVSAFEVSEIVPEVIEHSFAPIADTYTASALNTTPRGDRDYLRLRYSPFGDWRFDVYVKFDISDLPEDEVKGAKLRMYPTSALAGEPVTMGLQETTPDWSEVDLISATTPTIGAQVAQTLFTGDKQYYEWDVFSLFEQLIGLGENELSIRLRVPSGSSTENVYFASKEHEDVNLHPALILETEDAGETTGLNTPGLQEPLVHFFDSDRQLYLRFSADVFSTYRVYGVSGRLLTSGKLSGLEHTVDFSDIGSGVFIVRLVGMQHAEAVKVVIK